LAEKLLSLSIELDVVDGDFPSARRNSRLCAEGAADDLVSKADAHDGRLGRGQDFGDVLY